jgi:nitrate/nitrite transport system substrate-binding protein
VGRRRRTPSELADIVGKRQWFNCPPADIVNRIKGAVNYGDGRKIDNRDLSMKFWRDHASYPFQSHELWFLTENQRWGMMAADLDTKAIIAKVNREDLWREAAKAIGVAAKDMPASASRGKETFFDGKVFDPADPKTYIASLQIKKVA